MKISANVATKLPEFWRWFITGTGGRAGYRRIVNRWLLVHIAIGLVLAFSISASIVDVASRALLPLMAILIGITFSWAGNAHALLQSNEIIKLATKRLGGIAEYIFTFQLCILVILVTMALWVAPFLELPYLLDSVLRRESFDVLSSAVLYGLLSLAIRTSWHAVLGANMLLLARVQLMQPPDEKDHTETES